MREAFEGAREPTARRRCPTTCTRRCSRRCAAHGHRARSTRTRPRRWRRRADGPTIVTTGTASGKSLCFNLPTLDVAAAATPTARALYLYPTKALAQDQARALAALRPAPARAPGDLRRRHAARGARGRSASARNLVLTNPDMLHVGILPQPRARGATSSRTSRSSWSTRRTSTAACSARTSRNVLRRLRRIATAYGTEPRFLLACATIANPVELAERLTGPRRRRARRRATARPARGAQIAMWNPPLDRRGAADAAQRRSARRPSCSRELVREGARTICFMKSRKGVELVAKLVATSSPTRRPRAAPSGSRPTAPATRRSSGASSRRG